MNKIKYYNSIINDFKIERNDCHYKNDFINYICEQKNIDDVIKISAMSRDRNNKIFPHQERVYTISLINYTQSLLKVKNKIKKVKTFEKLYNILFDNKVSGIGDLTCYDIAMRIGQYLNIFPDYIYIHSGTKIGLENLLNKKIKDVYIKKEELPEPFCNCNLIPIQLEDLLCHFKDKLNYEKYINDTKKGGFNFEK